MADTKAAALFEDWDLGGDLEHLLGLLKRALIQVDGQRDLMKSIDAYATQCREVGAELSDVCRKNAPEVRARVGHYERQVARIKEQIARRDADAARMEKVSITLEIEVKRAQSGTGRSRSRR